MADEKQIKIGADASQLQRAKREVDALTQALEKLKKSGISTPGVGKVGDITTTAGVAKYSKELLIAGSSMDKLTAKAKAFSKAMGDTKVQTALKGLSKEYDTATTKLEKMARIWEKLETRAARTGRAISNRTRESFANAAATAQAERTSTRWDIKGLETATNTGFFGKGGGLDKGVSSLLARGPAIIGGAVGLAAMTTATGIPGAMYGRYTQQREAATGAAGTFNQYATQILTGQADKEAYLRRLGVEKRAQADSDRLYKLNLMSKGKFGAAMGAKSATTAGIMDYGLIPAAIGLTAGAATVAGSLALALPTGGGSMAGIAAAPMVAGSAALAASGYQFYNRGGIRGMAEDPAAQRSLAKQQERAAGRPSAEAREEVNVKVRDEYMSRMPVISDLQRTLDISEYNITAPLKTAGLGPYTFNQTTAAMQAMTGSGARGVDGGSIRGLQGVKEMQRMQRDYGIERAPDLARGLGLATGWAGQPDRQVKEVLASAMAAGFDRSELRVERNSFVEAVVAATERTAATRYLSAAAGTAEANVLGAVTQGKKGGPNQTDIAAAVTAMDVVRNITGAESGLAGALSARSVRQVMGKEGKHMTMAELGYLQRTSSQELLTDKTAQGFLEKYMSAGEATKRLKQLSEEKDLNILRMTGMGEKESRNLLGKKELGADEKRDLGVLLQQFTAQFPGQKQAEEAAAQLSKRFGLKTPTELGAAGTAALASVEAGAGGLKDTVAQKQERMIGQADLTLLLRAETQFKTIVGSIGDGEVAARNFDEVLKSLSGEDGSLANATESLDKNLRIITSRFNELAVAAGNVTGHKFKLEGDPDQPPSTE